MGAPAISKHDLNAFALDSHAEHVKELTDRGYTYEGFYVCEDGNRTVGIVTKEWYAFIWRDQAGKRYRTEQPKTGSVTCDVTAI